MAWWLFKTWPLHTNGFLRQQHTTVALRVCCLESLPKRRRLHSRWKAGRRKERQRSSARVSNRLQKERGRPFLPPFPGWLVRAVCRRHKTSLNGPWIAMRIELMMMVIQQQSRCSFCIKKLPRQRDNKMCMKCKARLCSLLLWVSQTPHQS